jgi:hypothetical protein
MSYVFPHQRQPWSVSEQLETTRKGIQGYFYDTRHSFRSLKAILGTTVVTMLPTTTVGSTTGNIKAQGVNDLILSIITSTVTRLQKFGQK